ncbi:Tripartite-type tricarboxylate transporter, receptor component TctC [Faunimonas pinastri]|uniref:Tripartite-type tricarboxylate transporter, receptor component TctC n=1 Tax=Faunimonas pinastri TaxID=1855383 RepID=A0A1H9E7A8_9HYPH|nr:tripartite tricarboxylate transporter substrate-binding protein [Faunimonas pinastri]SEQ21559.1 Tripartite-type tricarboxylate transporter, receptor component TctC [Faunimonas pinastri]
MAPVDFIVHGPPGSAPPVLAEAFLAGLAESAADSRDFRLLSRGDDPGVDAMELLIRRPGDPDVLSTCTPVFLQAPLLRGMSLTHRQLTPLARLVTDRFFLVARADAPWAGAAEFVRDLPRRTTRTGGYFKGGINHLLGLAIADGTGADVEFIVTPSEPAVWTALIEGRIDWGCGVAAEILPHVEAGTLRVIAALDEHRLSPFPDVPTLAEIGVPVTFKLWRGLMGPPGLSIPQQEHWHRVARDVTRTEAWRAYLARNGQSDGFLPGTAFAEFLQTEWDWYAKHLGLAGLLPKTPHFA